LFDIVHLNGLNLAHSAIRLRYQDRIAPPVDIGSAHIRFVDGFIGGTKTTQKKEAGNKGSPKPLIAVAVEACFRNLLHRHPGSNPGRRPSYGFPPSMKIP
jgi:hypothetical protein